MKNNFLFWVLFLLVYISIRLIFRNLAAFLYGIGYLMLIAAALFTLYVVFRPLIGR